jgi:hypothetical protein
LSIFQKSKKILEKKSKSPITCVGIFFSDYFSVFLS